MTPYEFLRMASMRGSRYFTSFGFFLRAIYAGMKASGRPAAGKLFKCLRVVERQVVEVDGDAEAFAHARDRIGEDRKVGEPEKVEFEEPRFLDGVHVVLRNDVIALRVYLDGR